MCVRKKRVGWARNNRQPVIIGMLILHLLSGTVDDEEKYMYGKEQQATSNNQDVDLAFSINVVVKDEGTTGNQ